MFFEDSRCSMKPKHSKWIHFQLSRFQSECRINRQPVLYRCRVNPLLSSSVLQCEKVDVSSRRKQQHKGASHQGPPEPHGGLPGNFLCCFLKPGLLFFVPPPLLLLFFSLTVLLFLLKQKVCAASFLRLLSVFSKARPKEGAHLTVSKGSQTIPTSHHRTAKSSTVLFSCFCIFLGKRFKLTTSLDAR